MRNLHGNHLKKLDLKNRNGKIIMFSVMVNHFNSPAGEIRKGIDEIVNKIQEKLE